MGLRTLRLSRSSRNTSSRDGTERLSVDTLGAPSASDLSMIGNPQAVEYIKALTKRERVPFERLYPNASREAIDLLNQMLVFDPRKRITAAQALQHEYLAALHNVNDEPDSETFSFPFEKKDVTENELRGLIWEQLRRFHPEAGRVWADLRRQRHGIRGSGGHQEDQQR